MLAKFMDNTHKTADKSEETNKRMQKYST